MSESLSTPVPLKIKQGEFVEDGLSLESVTGETIRLRWEEIVFVFLGKVEPKQSVPETKSSGPSVGKIVAGLAAGPLGTSVYKLAAKGGKNLPQGPAGEPFFIADLYITQKSSPLRLDSTGTNFRKLLKEEAGYSGATNLFGFIRKISSFVTEPLDSHVAAFLEKGKNFIPVFSSRDEFNWASHDRYRTKKTNM